MTDFTAADAFAALIEQMTGLARDVQMQSDLRYEAEADRDHIKNELEKLQASTFTADVVRREVGILMNNLNGGSLIEAIKAHRALTGYGLKESKDAVEAVKCRTTNSSAA